MAELGLSTRRDFQWNMRKRRFCRRRCSSRGSVRGEVSCGCVLRQTQRQDGCLSRYCARRRVSWCSRVDTVYPHRMSGAKHHIFIDIVSTLCTSSRRSRLVCSILPCARRPRPPSHPATANQRRQPTLTTLPYLRIHSPASSPGTPHRPHRPRAQRTRGSASDSPSRRAA